MTDIEGNLDYFRRSVAFSKVLELEQGQLQFRKPTGMFCYGGDVCDHGVGDIRISSMLADFKMRYPDRVFLITGNRDINKLRFRSEVSSADCNDHGSKTLVEKVQHMLADTMGAENAFEYRKMELKELYPNEKVTDEMVAKNFMASVEPGGFLWNYLQNAQLACIIEDCLFVHGALPRHGISFVPHRNVTTQRTVSSWVSELNQFYMDEVRTSNPYDLIEYGKPGGFHKQGIVYNDWLKSHDTTPQLVEEEVAQYLDRYNIRRVFTGHRPHGDSPTVIRSPGLTVVCADTSYSDKLALDNRGLAISETVIHVDEKRTNLHGVLRDGTPYDYFIEDDPVIGYPYKGGWVKVPLPDHRYIVAYSRGPGTYSSNLRYEVVHVDDIKNGLGL